MDPGDGDRYAFIEPAAKMYRWAMENERRILSDALRAELLELYNGTWRRNDQPQLSADELAERLKWSVLVLSASEVVPVEFTYAAGELFGHHGVAVEVDTELQFRDIDLQG